MSEKTSDNAEKKRVFLAFIMEIGGDIDEMRSFVSEQEADVFGIEETNMKLAPEFDSPDFFEKYDPPVVLLFESENTDAFFNGKYTALSQFTNGAKSIVV